MTIVASLCAIFIRAAILMVPILAKLTSPSSSDRAEISSTPTPQRIRSLMVSADWGKT
jgi:hypothetical protein